MTSASFFANSVGEPVRSVSSRPALIEGWSQRTLGRRIIFGSTVDLAVQADEVGDHVGVFEDIVLCSEELLVRVDGVGVETAGAKRGMDRSDRLSRPLSSHLSHAQVQQRQDEVSVEVGNEPLQQKALFDQLPSGYRSYDGVPYRGEVVLRRHLETSFLHRLAVLLLLPSESWSLAFVLKLLEEVGRDFFEPKET